MRRLTLFAFAAAAFVLPGCAVHHVVDPRSETVTRSYYDWEPDARYWGAHFNEYGQ